MLLGLEKLTHLKPIPFHIETNYLANIYLLKLNNGNSRKRCEICSRLLIKTPERPQ